jgi:hypothetical protein
MRIRKLLGAGAMTAALAAGGLGLMAAPPASASANCLYYLNQSNYFYGLAFQNYNLGFVAQGQGDIAGANYYFSQFVINYDTSVSFTQQYQRCNMEEP